MKIIPAILAIFLLGVTLVPCSDELANDSSKDSVSYHAQDQNDHEEPTDLCSPFCVCHCCHTHFTANTLFSSGTNISTIPLQNSSYLDPVLEGIKGSILQPPQV